MDHLQKITPPPPSSPPSSSLSSSLLSSSTRPTSVSSASSSEAPKPPVRSVCDKCGKSYKLKADLGRHIKEKHEASPQYSCYNFKESFDCFFPVVDAETRVAHPSCGFCGLVCPDQSSQRQHVHALHADILACSSSHTRGDHWDQHLDHKHKVVKQRVKGTWTLLRQKAWLSPEEAKSLSTSPASSSPTVPTATTSLAAPQPYNNEETAPQQDLVETEIASFSNFTLVPESGSIDPRLLDAFNNVPAINRADANIDPNLGSVPDNVDIDNFAASYQADHNIAPDLGNSLHHAAANYQVDENIDPGLGNASNNVAANGWMADNIDPSLLNLATNGWGNEIIDPNMGNLFINAAVGNFVDQARAQNFPAGLNNVGINNWVRDNLDYSLLAQPLLREASHCSVVRRDGAQTQAPALGQDVESHDAVSEEMETFFDFDAYIQ